MDCFNCKAVKVSLSRDTFDGYSPEYKSGDAICAVCYDEFHKLMNKMNKTNDSETTQYPENWGEASVSRWIDEDNVVVEQVKADARQVKNKEIKKVEEQMKPKEDMWINYLGGLGTAFKEEENYADLHVQPGSGPSIPAHKVMLAIRSQKFKSMLSSNASIIHIPELNHEELKSLLEFIYCGFLPMEKLKIHFKPLAAAAHKYDIPQLKKFCEEKELELLDY